MSPNQSPTREPQFTTPFSFEEWMKNPDQEVKSRDGRAVTGLHDTKDNSLWPLRGLIAGHDESWNYSGHCCDYEACEGKLFLTTPASPQLPEGEVAPGHNPYGLTVEDVGPAHKLMSLDEMTGDLHPEAEVWDHEALAWQSTEGIISRGYSHSQTYRVPLESREATEVDHLKHRIKVLEHRLSAAVEPLEKAHDSAVDTSTTEGKVIHYRLLAGAAYENTRADGEWENKPWRCLTEGEKRFLEGFCKHLIAPSPDVQPAYETADNGNFAHGCTKEQHDAIINQPLTVPEPAPTFQLGGYYLRRDGKMGKITHIEGCIYLDAFPDVAFHLPGIAPADINRVLYEEYFSKGKRPLKLGELRPEICEWDSILEGWIAEATTATNIPVCSHHKGVRCPINTPITMPEAKPVEAECRKAVAVEPEVPELFKEFEAAGIRLWEKMKSDISEAWVKCEKPARKEAP